MIYNIKKASEWFELIKPPCKEAKLDMRDNEWKITINTIKELTNLNKEVGELIIDKDEIIIYDSYVEKK